MRVFAVALREDATPLLSVLALPYVSETVLLIIAIVYMAVLSYLFKRWLDKQPVD